MTIKHFCDRCGKNIEEKNQRFFNIPTIEIILFPEESNIGYDKFKYIYELCDECNEIVKKDLKLLLKKHFKEVLK